MDHLIDSYNIIRDFFKLRENFGNIDNNLLLDDMVLARIAGGDRVYKKVNGDEFLYSFEDCIVKHFEETLLKHDLDKVEQGYGNTSANNGDYKGYMERILRKLKSIAAQIDDLGDFGGKMKLKEICNQFTPELLKRGINPQNLLLESTAVVVPKSEAPGLINPILLGDLNTEEAFTTWVRKLHKDLVTNRNYIEKCTLDDFKNIFTMHKVKEKYGTPLNWLTTTARFSLLMQELSNENYIAKRFWKQAASCFLFLGEPNSANNLKSYPLKTTNEDKKVVSDIISKIKAF